MITFVLIYNSACLILLLEETQTDFNDLGKLLFGGFGAAIVFALAFTFVRLRLREKSPQTSNFISIGATSNENAETKS